MTEDTMRRAYDLVEELRADIDFEIDEVIADIIRDLPDDYFRRLKRSDQLTHLKTLLAISVCQLDQEIMLRTNDDRHIAVIARKNYPGLLAKILKRLPKDQPLLEAQIFTSKTHNFIIDLFEFHSEGNESDLEQVEVHLIESTIESVVKMTGAPYQDVAEFVSHYPKHSQVLTSAEEIQEHFRAYMETQLNNDVAVHWKAAPEQGLARLTIATDHLTAREVFQRSAEFLAQKSSDIEEAFLNELAIGDDNHASVCSFIVSAEQGDLTAEPVVQNELVDFLKSCHVV